MRFLYSVIFFLLASIASVDAQSASYAVSGQGCPGSSGRIPGISASGLPVLGQRFDVLLDDATPFATVFMTVGSSTTQWSAGTLPFDLTSYGAAGCFVYTDTEIIFRTTTDAVGHATCALTTPNDPSAIGCRFFNQYLILDDDANPFGIYTTACGAGIVGT